MFSVNFRNRVRDSVIRLAESDPRVEAGAVIGSLAYDEGDRWSDLDLTFAVADEVPLDAVLDDWTRRITDEFRAVHLFDIASGAAIYRVFLLPGCLQFDLSFSPASDFGPLGPKFRLLFGTTVDKPLPHPPSPRELFGYGVHHALRARFCIERGRLWQAQYWINGVRDYAMSLACLHRGLPARFGRGYDQLPQEVRDAFLSALVRSLDRDELLRALSKAIAGLLREANEVREMAMQVEPELRELLNSEFR